MKTFKNLFTVIVLMLMSLVQGMELKAQSAELISDEFKGEFFVSSDYMITPKIMSRDFYSRVVNVYNDDMSLYITIDPKATNDESMVGAINGYIITQTLFNSDELIEYIVISTGKLAIMNELGDKLYELIDDNLTLDSQLQVLTINNNYYLSIKYINTSIYRINLPTNSVPTETTQSRSSVYPSSTSSEVQISYDLAAEGILTIMDMNGKVAMRKTLDAGASKLTVNVENYQPGTYVAVIVSNGKRVQTDKFIKY